MYFISWESRLVARDCAACPFEEVGFLALSVSELRKKHLKSLLAFCAACDRREIASRRPRAADSQPLKALYAGALLL
jgi:hypothetical protein